MNQYCYFCFFYAITPGPSNITLMSSGVNFGFRRSCPQLFGIGVGFPALVLVTGFGFSGFFHTYPVVQTGIKYVGIGYLLYLAWCIAMSNTKIEGEKRVKPFSFIQSASLQWVNPKAWVAALTAIATFTSNTQEEIDMQILMIAAVFLLVTIPCALLWLYSGKFLQPLLSNKAYQNKFNYIMAGLLITAIIPMLSV
ncbi:LysE family translocator [Shewanella surugensis]|uniref:LysE family translocator n=1 Tax=Shewanella surugensis TaxID=212020 RepID=A0ABT0L6K1_9GAMM|nr:LysE family translocator [Shewanella surugensis]MCL1122997.1 LysE family translocator [Shewanella surugensis]